MNSEPGAIWCTKKKDWVVRTFDMCQCAGDCSVFLRQELEKYEVLQHHRRITRQNRQNRQKPRPLHLNFQSASDTEIPSFSNETSDEERLGSKRRRQARVVGRTETRMRELIAHGRKESGIPDLYRYLEKEYDHRLRQVEKL